MINISVIITTYNQPQLLRLVLLALEKQTDLAFEVIIADDGSTQATADLIKCFQQKNILSIRHVWQVDDGFQAAKIRNKAIQAASGNYIIFLDGDCIPRPHFIEKHRILAAPGYFVGGNRSLLSSAFTAEIVTQSSSIESLNLFNYVLLGCKRKINRWFTLFLLPLGFLRYIHPSRWRGIKTCNLAVWKNDLLSVNGFDESYVGWGYEDSDLVLRLLRAAVKHKSGRFATTVLHLWHPENHRDLERLNFERFQKMKNCRTIKYANNDNQKQKIF